MGAVVLDSSVILGAFDPTDGLHDTAFRVIRQHLRNHASFALPAVVLAEVLVREARRSPTGAEQWRRNLITMFGPVRVIDDEIAVQAATLRAAHPSLRTPDALVIATGLVDEAEVILTADKRWAGVDERVEVLS
jgi:predicted nucleic acid-binding protein